MSPYLIIVLGVLTLSLRAVFLLVDQSSWERRAEPYLRRVPAAVLPVLAMSGMVTQVQGPDAVVRMVAFGLAGLVAWRTRNLSVTLAAGMVMLWSLGQLGE